MLCPVIHVVPDLAATGRGDGEGGRLAVDPDDGQRRGSGRKWGPIWRNDIIAQLAPSITGEILRPSWVTG